MFDSLTLTADGKLLDIAPIAADNSGKFALQDTLHGLNNLMPERFARNECYLQIDSLIKSIGVGGGSHEFKWHGIDFVAAVHTLHLGLQKTVSVPERTKTYLCRIPFYYGRGPSEILALLNVIRQARYGVLKALDLSDPEVVTMCEGYDLTIDGMGTVHAQELQTRPVTKKEFEDALQDFANNGFSDLAKVADARDKEEEFINVSEDIEKLLGLCI